MMLQKKILKAIVACWLMFNSFALATAQEQVDSIGTNVHLDNLTVTAKSAPSKTSSSTSVQVLKQTDFEAMGVHDVGSAVKRFAGTNVRDYGGIGGLKTVSVRNLGAAHTAVSYDGVAISNCQAGQIDVGRFSLNNVSTLSLAVGQDDKMLQSARLYASAGVLNIETIKPSYEEGRNMQTVLQVAGGSFGFVSPYIRHWHRVGKNTDLSLDFNYQRADSRYPFTLTNGKYITEEERRNSDVESYQGELNMYHTFGGGGDLNVKACYFHSERGLPGSIVLYNRESNERLWDENFFIQSKFEKDISRKWSVLVQGKFNYSWNKYMDKGVEYANGVQTDINRQNEYYLSASALYRALEKFSFSLSQDISLNTLHTNGVSSPEPVRYTSLTALSARYETQHVKMSGTVLGTFITDDVKTGVKPKDRSRLSPALSMSVKPWTEKNFYLRALCKNTFRAPTFTDLYYLRVGNTSLKPEKASEYGIGMTWSGRKIAFFEHLSFTVDGYYNEVTDKIIAFPSTYVWKMQNYGEVQMYGVDITMFSTVKFSSKSAFSLSCNYSWQRALDVTDVKAKNYKDQLPYTPEHNGNIVASLDLPWLGVGYSLSAVGKRYYLAQNIEENRIDGYCEHNVTAWREFAMKHGSLRLQLEVVNVADARYDVIKYYPMPGRSWRLTGTLKF